MIYLNGSTYEGGWDNDKKSGKGRMHDHISGDIYSGEYFEVGCTTLHCLRSTKESGSTIGGRAKALSSTLKEKFALASSELTTWKAK